MQASSHGQLCYLLLSANTALEGLMAIEPYLALQTKTFESAIELKDQSIITRFWLPEEVAFLDRFGIETAISAGYHLVNFISDVNPVKEIHFAYAKPKIFPSMKRFFSALYFLSQKKTTQLWHWIYYKNPY